MYSCCSTFLDHCNKHITTAQPFSIIVITLYRCSSFIALIIIWYKTFSDFSLIYMNVSYNMSLSINFFLIYVSQPNTSFSGKQFFSFLFIKSNSVFLFYCICFNLAYFISFSLSWVALYLIYLFSLHDANLFSSS